MFQIPTLQDILYLLPALLIGFTFHEYAHALVADRLGDKTPRFQGRLTLNPLVHIDIIGFIMILIFGFGWAKPVQTNPSAYRKYYRDDLKVSIAGPIANLLVALVFAIIFPIFYKIAYAVNMDYNLFKVLNRMLGEVIQINCTLFVLNLIPIPGFDGFHVLRDLFPKFFYQISDALYRYQFIIWILFLGSPLALIIIGKPANLIADQLFNLSGIILKALGIS